MPTLHSYFILSFTWEGTSVKGYMIQLPVDWFSSFSSYFRSVLYRQCRYSFYNFLELYPTLFEMEK